MGRRESERLQSRTSRIWLVRVLDRSLAAIVVISGVEAETTLKTSNVAVIHASNRSNYRTTTSNTTLNSEFYVSWQQFATAEHIQTYSEDLWLSQLDIRRCNNAFVYDQARQSYFYSPCCLPVMHEIFSDSGCMSLGVFRTGYAILLPLDHRYGWDLERARAEYIPTLKCVKTVCLRVLDGNSDGCFVLEMPNDSVILTQSSITSAAQLSGTTINMHDQYRYGACDPNKKITKLLRARHGLSEHDCLRCSGESRRPGHGKLLGALPGTSRKRVAVAAVYLCSMVRSLAYDFIAYAHSKQKFRVDRDDGPPVHLPYAEALGDPAPGSDPVEVPIAGNEAPDSVTLDIPVAHIPGLPPPVMPQELHSFGPQVEPPLAPYEKGPTTEGYRRHRPRLPRYPPEPTVRVMQHQDYIELSFNEHKK